MALHARIDLKSKVLFQFRTSVKWIATCMYHFQQVKIEIMSEGNICNGTTCQHLFEIKLLDLFQTFPSRLLTGTT